MDFETFKQNAKFLKDYTCNGNGISFTEYVVNNCFVCERVIMPYNIFQPQRKIVIVLVPLAISEENIKLIESYGGMLKEDDTDYLRDGYAMPKFYCENYKGLMKHFVKPKANPLRLAFDFIVANYEKIKADFAE